MLSFLNCVLFRVDEITDNNQQNPEQIVHDKIDQMLISGVWLVQSKDKFNLSAGMGIAQNKVTIFSRQ